MSTVPFFPIVYLRGYAGSQTEVEETVANPFMGFNLGSTKIRQLWTGDIDRYIFESPLVRLMKDHGYQDIYEDGAELRPVEEYLDLPVLRAGVKGAWGRVPTRNRGLCPRLA